MKTVWQKLPRPFFVLAPMENVTDTVFRRIVLQCGRPDVFFTEFTNVDGLISKGHDHVVHRLHYTEAERPIIAQIWGNNPQHYYDAVKIVKDLKFDGVDINMGCPVNKVVTKGFCAGLIRNPSLAKEIILATKEAAGDMPVSVKTRIGYSNIQTEEWIGFLLELKPAAITVHARTAAEMSKVPAHWEEIGKAVALRNSMKSETVIIGNGDVKSRQDGMEKYEQYKMDGVMIGRGVFDNVWIFNKDIDPQSISHQQKIQTLIEHIELFDKVWGKQKNPEIMKKFYKVYVSGMPDAAEFRAALMQCKGAEETVTLLKEKINKKIISV
jgi:nifR3 family TIM-barrel protein